MISNVEVEVLLVFGGDNDEFDGFEFFLVYSSAIDLALDCNIDISALVDLVNSPTRDTKSF
jgi:hypothetical protein